METSTLKKVCSMIRFEKPETYQSILRGMDIELLQEFMNHMKKEETEVLSSIENMSPEVVVRHLETTSGDEAKSFANAYMTSYRSLRRLRRSERKKQH